MMYIVILEYLKFFMTKNSKENVEMDYDEVTIQKLTLTKTITVCHLNNS